MKTIEKKLTPKQQEREEALKTLREWMPKGTTVYTILRHVSKSGMSRDISLVVFKDGEKWPIHPNYTAAKAMGWRLVEANGCDAIRVGGCGMDMGFHLVYSLSSAMYRNADGSYNHEGAYSLKQEWL